MIETELKLTLDAAAMARAAAHPALDLMRSVPRRSEALPTTALPAASETADIAALPPNQYGYVVVQTAGGDTQCIVDLTLRPSGALPP